MTLLYQGKTKDIIETPDGWLFRFKDSLLGRRGNPDPGGNEIIGDEPGRGALSLRVASWVFEELRTAGIPTHFVATTPDGMLVRPTERIPLEIVVRNVATGGFIARYGGRIAAESPLPGLVELTLKDDRADDPLITPEAAAALGLASPEELAEIDRLARAVNRALLAAFARQGVALADFKLEFGRDLGTRQLMVIDEIGVNSMRARRAGKPLSAGELAAALEK